jgi:hypothetical protein
MPHILRGFWNYLERRGMGAPTALGTTSAQATQ